MKGRTGANKFFQVRWATLISHPGPREEATAFSEPRGTEGEGSSCLPFPWELEGVSGCIPFLRSAGNELVENFPLQAERMLFPSPIPTPTPAPAHQFSGQPWFAVWAFLSAHN